MDVRLTSEQRQLREAAARLADELGPGSVLDLDDGERVARLEKAVAAAGWRSLRSDGASGVEVAIVAEEFGRGLVDVPFLGPILADDLLAGDRLGAARSGDGGSGDGPLGEIAPGGAWTIAVGGTAIDARGRSGAVQLERGAGAGGQVLAGRIDGVGPGVDLTRRYGTLLEPLAPVGALAAEQADRWLALALVVTCADLVGAARGAHAVAVDYAKVRTQYGRTIGSYQAVAHLLAEGRALIEGSISVLRHAAWAVDDLAPDEALRAARVAKVYSQRAARTIAETAIQVHGGIGNTWDCLVHVHLRRILASTTLFPVRLEEIDLGFS